LGFIFLRDFQIKNIQKFLVVRARCPLITKDRQDFGVSAQSFPAGRYANDKAQEPSNAAHPTRWNNLFSGVP